MWFKTLYEFSVLTLGPPVKFSNDPNLPDEECHSLLREHMPAHVVKNKVLQQLFIKYILNDNIANMYCNVTSRYMERRCKFLESFPGFNYNSGNYTAS